MKLAVSNLSWEEENDDIMYQYLFRHGIGLEVVPSRIFKWERSALSNRPVSPFEHFSAASDWYRIINTHYLINIASMHSLLYNVDKNLFAGNMQRIFLMDYLQRAVQFAARINCPNLCFGCAPNRTIPPDVSPAEAAEIGAGFFDNLADYARENGICVCIEPIAAGEGTNYINTTQQAFDLVKMISNPGFKVCVSIGTIIENRENIDDIFTKDNIGLINHIHISEPGLAPLKERQIYADIAARLKELKYKNYISVEILRFPDVKLLQGAVNYFETLL